jgi:hypothetical protein
MQSNELPTQPRVIDFKAINITCTHSVRGGQSGAAAAHMNRVNGWVAMVIRVGGRADDYNEPTELASCSRHAGTRLWHFLPSDPRWPHYSLRSMKINGNKLSPSVRLFYLYLYKMQARHPDAVV